MAPTKPNPKKAKSKARHIKKRRESGIKTPRQLRSEATAALTQGDAVSALSYAQQALDAADGGSTHPLWASLHTLLGEACLELGDTDMARKHFETAVSADPDGALPEDEGGGVVKFLYLAQLSDTGGIDSVRWFERGAAALRQQLSETDASGTAADASAKRQKLAEILCAVAEVYMTDLSHEVDCEERCEALVTEATLLAPECPDVWQTLASVRISQNREADAKMALERSIALWEDLPPDDAAVPDFAVRMSLLRLLMTVGLLEKAVEVAERCIREDDQVVDLWYLGGYALHLIGEALKEGGELSSWKTNWISARRWLRRCLKLFDLQDYEDERLKEHAEEILSTIAEALGEAPPDEDDDLEDTGSEDDDDGDSDDGEMS